MKNHQVLFLTLSLALCLLVLAGMMGLVGNRAQAQVITRYVAMTGADVGDCASPTYPCRTIQYAMDAAVDRDVIRVAEGIYNDVHERPAPAGYEGPATVRQVLYIDKDITVRGGFAAPGFADPPDPEANPTTLDAQGAGRAILVGPHTSATIEGLRMINGNATDLLGGPLGFYDAGGAVYGLTATVTINQNGIENSSAEFGGGMYFGGSTATFTGNTIQGNAASAVGGGFYFWKSDGQVRGNTIALNSAGLGGGACYLVYGDSTLSSNTVISNGVDYETIGLHFTHATVSGNILRANDGTAIETYQSDVTISDNTISRNQKGLIVHGGHTTVRGNLVSENAWAMAFQQASGLVSENRLTANSGGICLWVWMGNVTMTNNLVTDNVCDKAALWVLDGAAHLLHNTFARNKWYTLYGPPHDGIAIHLERLGEIYTPTATLSNTIIVSHDIGILSEGAATLKATLWGTGTWANHTDWRDWDGQVLSTGNVWGDPAFVDAAAGDYHTGPGSAALDQGIDAGVHVDIDYQLRPYQSPDLGVDEYWPPRVLKHSYLPLVLRNAP